MRALVLGAALAAASALPGPGIAALPDTPPAAVVDLATPDGVALVKGQWRYSDARIVEARFFEPGPDGQPSWREVGTYDYLPKAGARDFPDGDWTAIEPESLRQPRGHGHLAFNWYRIRVTVPASVDGFDTRGSTVVFETRVDDYAEIWVDGEITYGAEDSGGPVVRGWNATNRLVVGRDVHPGQSIQIALFGINGPVSRSPTNYIFLHFARLSFHPGARGPAALPVREANIDVDRFDPEMDAVVGRNPKAFKLAEGFRFTEGPVWDAIHGALLFSDPNANTMYRYAAESGLSIVRRPSGYAGADVAEYAQPGSNGIALDSAGRTLFADHGNRRVARIESDGQLTVLAERYRGRRFNSPNDLVVRSDGSVYFTDPPFGLPRQYEDRRRELPFSGVYRWHDGEVTLLAQELAGPNGLAFSPDERWLYVGNWEDARKVVVRHPVLADGTLGAGTVFADLTTEPGGDAIDGLKVDRAGHLFVCGPGGIWVFAPDGRRLGRIRLPRQPHNLAWGDDGRSLYVTAESALYRVPVRIAGPVGGVKR